MGEERFYGSVDALHPIPSIAFAFADAEDEEAATLSVLQTLAISFHHYAQLPLMVTTDVYYLRGPDPVEPGNLVKVQRVMGYTPTLEGMTPSSDEAWQAVHIALERFQRWKLPRKRTNV